MPQYGVLCSGARTSTVKYWSCTVLYLASVLIAMVNNFHFAQGEGVILYFSIHYSPVVFEREESNGKRYSR